MDDAGDIVASENGGVPAPGRAMRVAHALAARDGDEFAKPGNLVEVRFVKGQSLSLTAARLLALMILTAGGDAWEPVAHRMRKADIRRLYVCGIVTNGGVASTVRECHVRDLDAVVLEDGCAAFSEDTHRTAIEALRPVAPVMTITQALREVGGP